MRARWAILISGGVLALAIIVVLWVSPRLTSPTITVLNQQTLHGATFYFIQISNTAPQPYVYTARMEYRTNGTWEHARPHQRGGVLLASGKDIFVLFRPTNSSMRIAVFYNQRSGSVFERWRETLRMRVGAYPHGQAMYIDAP